MTIPDQYKEICQSCGATLDARDLGQVLAHGNFNMTAGRYECGEPQDVQYQSSRKVGEAFEGPKGKPPVPLN